MDDTTNSTFLSHAELAQLLPGYRLDSAPLSTTAMSRVYLAVDTRLHHRKVAVKIMAESLAAHPGYRKRFLREIQLMAGLEHPNIIYIITAAEEDDRLLYLVMPRAKKDLRSLLTDGPLDMAQTVHTVTQVAKALDHAHDHGVVHRDVKPGNILFGDNGHVYLCDFGVAKEHFGEDLTSAGETIGTRRYTAPEVYGGVRSAEPVLDSEPVPAARRLPATPQERSGDVYSLGAVLYHCLTGQRPGEHVLNGADTATPWQDEPSAVSRIRPELPAAIDGVVSKAMHLDPRERYRSCGELSGALTQAVGLSGEESAMPVLRDILARLPVEPGQADRTALFYADNTMLLPSAGPAGRTARPLGMVTTLTALLLLAATLAFLFLDRDADGATAEDTGTGTTLTTDAQGTPGGTTSRPPPVTGEDQVARYPVEGECLAESEDWLVVSCDSEDAVEFVFRIVDNPEDPNPSQVEHEDAAWLACGAEGFDYHYYWKDSATADENREWDPKTDRIYYFICYRNL